MPARLPAILMLDPRMMRIEDTVRDGDLGIRINGEDYQATAFVYLLKTRVAIYRSSVRIDGRWVDSLGETTSYADFTPCAHGEDGRLHEFAPMVPGTASYAKRSPRWPPKKRM